MLLALAAIAGAIGGVGCARGEPNSPLRLVTRDSSGVEIAEIQGNPWSARAWATLDTTPLVRIEPDDARPETLFGRVRGTLRLSDGSIAVLDVGRHRIQVFAPDGSFIRSIGREGQGPGEFDQPWRLVRAPADTLGVYDMAGHIELLTASGDGSRRLRLPWGSEVGTAQILGSFREGGYLAIMNEFPGRPQAGSNPLFSALHAMDPAGNAGPALGRHQSTSFTFREGSDGRLRQVATLFWAEPGMVALPSGYAWCISPRFDCQIWSKTGDHVRSIRAEVSSREVDAAAVATLTEAQLRAAQSAADSARVRADFAEADRMERFPVLSLIRADSRGAIWIREYVWPPSALRAQWLVLEPTGRVLGTVTTPANLQVFDIGDDYILGVDRDADDAERVVMYRYSIAR